MRITVFIIAAIFLANGAICQKTFEEFTQFTPKQQSKHIKLWKVFKIDKYGRGTFPDLTKKELKKVALVAYTISTPLQWSKYSPTYNLTDDGMRKLVNKLYTESIEQIKESFKIRGIELVTIETMNANQKAVMADAKGEKFLQSDEKSNKLYNGYNKLSSKQANLGVAAKGYKNWKLIYELVWPWSVSVLGKMADALDVDAVLLINNEINITREFAYASCVTTMAGINPIPKIEGRKYPGLSYNNGMVYGQGLMAFNKPIVFSTVKKKKIISENYKKFGETQKVLIQTILADIKKRQLPGN